MEPEGIRLIRALAALSEVSGVRIALVGGAARNVWAHPRATLDLDAIAGTDVPGPLIEAAARAGLVAIEDEVAALRSADMTRLRLPDHPRGAVRIDLLLSRHPYFERVLARARAAEVAGVTLRVACAEDVIVLKLLADRAQDRADVEAIVAAQGDRLDRDLLLREAGALELDVPAAILRRP